MSIEWMSLVFSRPEPRGPVLRLVLLTLADIANNEGECYPSVRYIAARAAIAERTVQNALRVLEVGGFISVKLGGRNAISGARRASVYTLIKGAPHAPSDATKGAADAPLRVHATTSEGAPHAPTRVHATTSEGAPHAPQPSGTIIQEPSGNLSARADRPNSIEDVLSYAAEIRLDRSEAEKFFDHFEANGWRQGGRTAIRSWRAALRNWSRRVRDFSFPKKSSVGSAAAAGVPFDPNQPHAYTGGLAEV